MSERIESLATRVEGAMASDRLEKTGGRYLRAVLWEIDAEAWERGVMYGGGVGTIKPKRPRNPYLDPPKPVSIPGDVWDQLYEAIPPGMGEDELEELYGDLGVAISVLVRAVKP